MAHLYETGGMRRVHLKGRNNILKRLLVHAGGFNLALVMRKLVGVGKPRRLQGLILQPFRLLARNFFFFLDASEAPGQGHNHFALQSQMPDGNIALHPCGIQVTRPRLAA